MKTTSIVSFILYIDTINKYVMYYAVSDITYRYIPGDVATFKSKSELWSVIRLFQEKGYRYLECEES